MKKLLFFLMVLFLFLTANSSNVYAIKVSDIVNQPITYSDLTALKLLVREHKHFSSSDFRNLLRNYIGTKNTTPGGRQSILSLMKSTSSTIKSQHSICDKYRYYVKNDKIVRSKIAPICYSYNKITNPGHSGIATMLHFHNNGKVLAMLTYSILNNYPNIKKNINAYGKNWQTALWIASDRALFHTVYVILKYSNANVNITGISPFAINHGSCHYNKGRQADWLLWSCQTNFKIPHKWIENEPYVCQDLINAGGGVTTTMGTLLTTGFQASYIGGTLVFFSSSSGVETIPYYALALNSTPPYSKFDYMVFKILFKKSHLVHNLC